MKPSDAGADVVAEPLVLLKVSHGWFACAVNCSVPLPAFDTVICPAAAALPCVSEKFSMSGETERMAGLDGTTVMVTATPMLVLPAVIVTLPVDVPTGRLATLTETGTEPGRCSLRCSHREPVSLARSRRRKAPARWTAEDRDALRRRKLPPCV